MATMWWLIIRTPDGMRCWPAGDDPAEHARLVTAGRILAGVPANDEWAAGGTGFDVQLTGEPHELLLQAATVGTQADLLKVDQAAVDDHDAQRTKWARSKEVHVLGDMLARADDADLEVVLARPDLAGRLELTTKRIEG